MIRIRALAAPVGIATTPEPIAPSALHVQPPSLSLTRAEDGKFALLPKPHQYQAPIAPPLSNTKTKDPDTDSDNSDIDNFAKSTISAMAARDKAKKVAPANAKGVATDSTDGIKVGTSILAKGKGKVKGKGKGKCRGKKLSLIHI